MKENNEFQDTNFRIQDHTSKQHNVLIESYINQ